MRTACRDDVGIFRNLLVDCNVANVFGNFKRIIFPGLKYHSTLIQGSGVQKSRALRDPVLCLFVLPVLVWMRSAGWYTYTHAPV